jgi:hypothetical protein
MFSGASKSGRQKNMTRKSAIMSRHDVRAERVVGIYDGRALSGV